MTHAQLTQLVQALLDAPTSNPTLKESVAEQNIALIDETIGFAGSDLAKQMLGAEVAAQLLQHAKDIKAKGAEFCDCPGCTACKHVIDLKAKIA